MKALVIAWTRLRRLFKDRLGLFFVLIFPVQITLLIGVAIFKSIGGGLPVGVLNEGSGPFAAQLVERLDASPALAMRLFDDLDVLRAAVRREAVEAGVVVPATYDADLRGGRTAAISFLSGPGRNGPAIRSTVSGYAHDQGALVRAALFASAEGGGAFDDNFAKAAEFAARDEGGVTVKTETVGTKKAHLPTGFGYPAASNLVLFVFINSLAAAGQLIESRRSGVSLRMLGTPTSARAILLGHALGGFFIALFQGLFIFAMGALLFGVKWGDPLGTAALIFLFCLVATGVAMLFGTVLRTPEQAASIGVPLGIGMGMLGGTMWPLEIVSPTMKTVGHFTPHAWAMDSFIALMARGAGIGDIARELSVLAALAVVLLTVATRRLRRSLTG